MTLHGDLQREYKTARASFSTTSNFTSVKVETIERKRFNDNYMN